MSVGRVFANLGRKIDDLNTQAVIPDNLTLKGKPYAVDFGVAMNKLGISLDNFTLVKGASSKLELAYKGKVTNLTNAIRAANKSGDLIGSLRELNIPPAVRNSAQVRSYADRLRLNFTQQPWVKKAGETAALTETGLDLRRRLKGPAPDTPMQARNALDQNATFKKYVDIEIATLNNKIAEASKGGSRTFTVGKVIKTTFTITGAAITLAVVINLVFTHMNNMNGCWLVNTVSNSRCKIPLLTCDKVAGAEGTTCRPLKQCGPSQDQPCFSRTTCIEYNKPIEGQEPSQPPTCKRTLANVIKSCQGCSSYCNVDKLQLPSEYTLECVNVNFWGALVDFFGGVSSSLYKGIINLLSGNFLLYIALVIVALIIYNLVT